MISEADLPPNARILVTGASGYLGQALLKTLWSQAPKTWQWVLTDVQAARIEGEPAGVRWVIGDLTDERLRQSVAAEPLDAVVHLAGLMSGRTEQDVALGEQINLQASMALMALCRDQFRRGGRQVRWVMTSSIAVYGVPMPLGINDQTPFRPSLSYGTHKRMLELMMDDMNRRGDLDARAVRLAGVVIRPALPSGALSGFNSDLLREPLMGRNYTCPVAPEASVWLSSLSAAVSHVSRLIGMSGSDWRLAMGAQGSCAFNAPAWPAHVSDLVQAMALIDPLVPSRIQFLPQADLQAQFGAWPMDVSFERARRLDLLDEREAFGNDLAAFVRQLWLSASF
jgi:D-erythronate 2-dehydrogenase